MAYLLFTLGVVVIAVGVALSIALHEIGHLVPAKLFGVKCSQYMIGFGPTIWSTRRGETEYGLKAVPLGGYVRMIGMFPPKPGRPARADSTGRLGLLIDQARADAQRGIEPGDAGRLFYQRSVPKRLVIMLGGPVMNLVIAAVLLTGLVTGYGVSTDTTTLDAVYTCALPVTAAPTRTCTAADTPAPAARAGLLPGDRITAMNGTAVSTWRAAMERIRANRGTPMTIVVDRAGSRVTLTATPLVDTRYALDANGNPYRGADGKYVTQQVGFLGVSPAKALVRQPLTAVPGFLGDALAQTAGVVLRIPEKMVGVVQAAFGDGERDPNGPISIVGIGRVAGEVGAAQGTASAPLTLADKVVTWLGILASLNLALFVFNLIPLLPLDGGHVAGALWEGLRRQVARLRRRPDPGPVDIARALPLAYAVAAVLIGMSALLMYADIVKPVRLG